MPFKYVFLAPLAIAASVGAADVHAAADVPTPAVETECDPGEQLDCSGHCVPVGWVGDGVCDQGRFSRAGEPVRYDCPQFSFDGGDCASARWQVTGPAETLSGGFGPGGVDVATFEVDVRTNIRATTMDVDGECSVDTEVSLWSVVGEGLHGFVARDTADAGTCSRVDVQVEPGLYRLQVSAPDHQPVPTYLFQVTRAPLAL